MLSEDKDVEYYRNRCSTLEQQINQLNEDSRQLNEDSRQLREELAAIKETVSALVARNIKETTNRTTTPVTKRKNGLNQTIREKMQQTATRDSGDGLPNFLTWIFIGTADWLREYLEPKSPNTTNCTAD